MQHEKKILALAVFTACGGHTSAGFAQTTGTNNGNVEELIVFGTQGARESTTGSRLDLTVLETPATVDIIDGDAIRARIDTNVLDAATRSAGFTNEANPGNGSSSIAARGFNGQGAVTKLYDGTNYYNAASTVTFPFDTWSVERVEVLKGPSSVLYGEGGIGGAINVIPRAPQREQSGDVRLILGEDEHAVHRRRLHECARRLGCISRRLRQQPVRQLGAAERGQRGGDAGARRAMGRHRRLGIVRAVRQRRSGADAVLRRPERGRRLRPRFRRHEFQRLGLRGQLRGRLDSLEGELAGVR